MSPNDNPYDFFLNQPVKPAGPVTKDNNFKHRLLVIGAGGILLILILVILFGVILRPSTAGADAMYQIAATQQDLVELTETGEDEVKDLQLLNTALSIKIVVSSQYYETNQYITKSSFAKNSSAKIKVLRDTKFKTTLDEAKSSGTYDDSFRAILATE